MSDTDRMVGLWSLVGAERTEPDGTTSPPYGPAPVGRLVYTRGNYMSAHIRGSKDAPSVVAYCGTWRVEGDQVVHEVLVGSNNNPTGGTMIRRVSWEGEDLVLSAAGWRQGETAGSRVLRWRKLEELP